jgi:addiction module HigA family antidote
MACIRTNPGGVLREEFMKPLELSANVLALALRVTAMRIGEILRDPSQGRGKPRAVTADTGMRLARYFGPNPSSGWTCNRLWNLSVALARHGLAIESEAHPTAELAA